MSVSVIIFLVLLFLISFLLFFFRSNFPELSGPDFRQYLPGGDVFPLLWDSQNLNRTLLTLYRKHGKVFQMWLGPVDCIVTAVPADVAHILSSTTVFARSPVEHVVTNAVVPGSLFTMPTAVHHAARRHLRENFNSSLLESFHYDMNEAIGELLQSLSDSVDQTPVGLPSEVVNITEQITITTSRVITNGALGFDLTREERLELAANVHCLLNEMLFDFICYPVRQALTPLGVRNRLFESKKNVDNFCRRFIQTRMDESKEQKEARSADVLDAIVTLKDHDMVGLTSQTMLFTIAGSHTVGESLRWSIYETCCNPQVAAEMYNEISEVCRDRAQDESLKYEEVDRLSYVKRVWKETLRLHPPASCINRESTKDVCLAGSGIHVPKGSQIIALIQGAHINDEVWTQPADFNPNRWLNGEGDRAPAGSFVPFSVGPSNCPGRFLAEHEGVLILAELHRRYEFSLACKPEDVVTCSGWIESLWFRTKENALEHGVPVKLKSWH